MVIFRDAGDIAEVEWRKREHDSVVALETVYMMYLFRGEVLRTDATPD